MAEDCRWEVTEQLVLTDPTTLQDAVDPMTLFLTALARATVEPRGRVDLLTCDMLGTWACPEDKWPKLMPLAPIEEATGSRFTASCNAMVGNPLEGDDNEWVMETDESVDVRASYFVPPTQPQRLPAMRQRYALGMELGRGQFATAFRAVRIDEAPTAAGPTPPSTPRQQGKAAKAARAVKAAKASNAFRSGGIDDKGASADAASEPLEVAIKVINKAKCASMHEVEAEVEIMRKLRHPHIIRLHETFDAKRRMYLVLELATGGELFDRIIERGLYTEADAAATVQQLAMALAYLARLKVTHGDLKPANLLLATPAADAPLKVADFGLASVVLGPSTHAASALCGSPDYMAPEILAGAPRAHAPPVDMFACGVIVYVMLSGELPFGGTDGGLARLFDRITNGEYDRCSGDGWSQISADAKAAVVRMLEVDRSKRLTAEELMVHPWLHLAAGGDAVSLHKAQDALRSRLRRERLQRVGRGVVATRRLQDEASKLLASYQSAGRDRVETPRPGGGMDGAPSAPMLKRSKSQTLGARAARFEDKKKKSRSFAKLDLSSAAPA